MSLRNRTVIITGASSGIGRRLSLHVAHAGARVVLAARSASQLDALAETIRGFGGEALAVPTDVTDDAQVAALIERALEAYGAIDVLVNNAGYGVFTPVEDSEMRHISGMMDVNYLGTMRCIQAVLPVMRRQGRGHIVTIASVAGLVSTQNMGAYAASKHAVVAAVQALQVELAATPIKASLICPGPIDTPFFVSADYNAMSRFAKAFGLLDPDEVTRIVARVIDHPRTMRVIPRVYHLLVLASRLSPFLTKWVLRWVG